MYLSNMRKALLTIPLAILCHSSDNKLFLHSVYSAKVLRDVVESRDGRGGGGCGTIHNHLHVRGLEVNSRADMEPSVVL